MKRILTLQRGTVRVYNKIYKQCRTVSITFLPIAINAMNVALKKTNYSYIYIPISGNRSVDYMQRNKETMGMKKGKRRREMHGEEYCDH